MHRWDFIVSKWHMLQIVCVWYSCSALSPQIWWASRRHCML